MVFDSEPSVGFPHQKCFLMFETLTKISTHDLRNLPVINSWPNCGKYLCKF